MMKVTVPRLSLGLALCLGLVGICARAQSVPTDAPPTQPFHAVHLLWIDLQQPDAEKTVLTAVASMNQVIAKAGCPDCIYHLWKVSGQQNGSHNYLLVSDWPGRAMYDKVHNSPEYLMGAQSWLRLRSVVKSEVYNRYVEMQPPK
jgi:hypothetical protein